MRLAAPSTASLSYRLLVTACWAMLLLFAPLERSNAAIHACPTLDGSVQYQDRPCSTRTSTNDRAGQGKGSLRTDVGSAAGGAARRRPPPAGIDESWFEKPAEGSYTALCDDNGCECGSLERTFDFGLEIAVADALYLDGAWHRYDAALQESSAPSGDRTPDAFALRAELEDAACEINIAQSTLRRFADRVLMELRRRARDAVDLGRDAPSACDGFSESACRDFESLQLYQRMLVDAKALQTPRPSAAEPR